MSSYIDVTAESISKKHIIFYCATCRKNHVHGSAGLLNNRVETRGSHCLLSPYEFRITINDKTKRK